MKNPFAKLGQRFKQPLKPKKNRFIERLEQQAELLVQGTDALRDYMKKPNKKNTNRVKSLEQAGDEVRRIFIDELNRSFVTPIDREDLYSLSRMLDDVLDLAESAMREMDALNVQPNQSLQMMAELLYNSSKEILLAIQRFEKHPSVANQHIIRIKKLENDMQSQYTTALASLFNNEPKNMADLMIALKQREIYQYMLSAMHGANSLSDTISHVVVKLF